MHVCVHVCVHAEEVLCHHVSIKTRCEILSCVYLSVWVVCVLLAALVCVGGSGFEASV